jgi:hypothetical protein
LQLRQALCSFAALLPRFTPFLCLPENFYIRKTGSKHPHTQKNG